MDSAQSLDPMLTSALNGAGTFAIEGLDGVLAGAGLVAKETGLARI